MAITYTWQDADETSLKYVDDSTTPDTELYIPVDSDNRHYAAYLDWVADGNTATAYVAPPVVADSRTDTEKLEQLTGLTVAEIKAVLGIY